MRSRVMPGSSPTMARRDPTSRLKSVDLPTLGRPTIASVPTVGGSPCSAVRLDSNCIRRFTKTLSAAIAPTAIAPSGYYRDKTPRVVSSKPQSAALAARLPSLYQFFGPGGVLARTHPAYEFRRGQLQMAEAVEQALQERRHLIVEAGTGTGKTLAYLLPVIRSGKRVIISTGTKTLQEQLFFKDVPFLREHLGELRVCYMKGRGNYLCRKKLYDLTAQPLLNGLEEISHFRIISDWEKTTETGDRAELAELPENSHLWPKLDARTDRCIGSQCQQFDRCFITEMRRRAAESDIIIVNHHLFCADLAIKAAKDRAPDAGVLPDAGIVVFDEAHELEDVATNYFGVTVSNLRVDELLRDVEHTLRRVDVPLTDILKVCNGIKDRSQFFFSLLPPGEGRFAFENRPEFLEENGDEYLGLQNSLLHLYTELQAIPNKPDEVHALAGQRVEVRRQHRGEGFALTGPHLGDVPHVHGGAAHDLHVEVPLAERPPGGLPDRGERLGKQVVERFTGRVTLTELVRQRAQFRIAQRGEILLDRVDLVSNPPELAQGLAFTRAKDPVDNDWHFSSRSLRIVCLMPESSRVSPPARRVRLPTGRRQSVAHRCHRRHCHGRRERR